MIYLLWLFLALVPQSATPSYQLPPSNCAYRPADMGKKERERKAKRALAELGHAATPCKAMRHARLHARWAKKAQAAVAKANAPSAKVQAAVGNEPSQVVEPFRLWSLLDGYKPDWITTGATQPEKDTTTTGSASSSEPPKPARAPPPNPAAGSGNPASSVSSGGVEAELKVVIFSGVIFRNRKKVSSCHLQWRHLVIFKGVATISQKKLE